MNSTESTLNSPDWSSLQGRTLEGGYELKEIVAAENDRVVFRVRVLGDYSLRASARFYMVTGTSGEEQIALWEAARTLGQRGNLRTPLDTGTLLLNDVEVIYAVLENAEETLGDVLRKRALGPEEATEVLTAIRRGLEELHAHGLVHGCLSPEEVLAMGDAIKLSAECVRRINVLPVVEQTQAKYLAPESRAHNLTLAADVWCLGATLFEALTRKVYQPILLDETSGLNRPFDSIARCSLDPDPDVRCQLNDLEQIAKGKIPANLKVKPVVSAAPIAAPVQRAVEAEPAKTAPETLPKAEPQILPNELAGAPNTGTKAAATPKLPNEPVRAAKLPNELRPRRELSEESVSRGRTWIYVVAGLAVILLVILLSRSRSRSGERATQNATPAPAVVTPQPRAAWPTKTLTPESRARAGGQNRQTAAPAKGLESAGQANAIWRVVIYTYTRQGDAEKKAVSINGKHPDLNAQTFSPSGNGGPYLVVVGGRTTREEAARMRLRVIRLGMPHDTYIQNYKR